MQATLQLALAVRTSLASAAADSDLRGRVLASLSRAFFLLDPPVLVPLRLTSGRWLDWEGGLEAWEAGRAGG